MKKIFSSLSLLVVSLAACNDGGPGPVSDIEIRPRSVLLNFPGASADLSVVGLDDGGNEADASGEKWTSLDPAIVGVDGSGKVTGVANGVGRVSASVGDFADTIDVTVFNIAGGYFSIAGREIVCADGMAAEFECNGVDLQSFVALRDLGVGPGDQVNDVWGWTSADNRDFALVGTTAGVSFVELSDPLNPVLVGTLPRTPGPFGVWRDVKVYNDHAFVVADGSGDHGMQVFDLTQLLSVNATPQEFSPLITYRQFGSAHNIAINEESGYAYVVGVSSGGTTCGGGLHIIDVRNPANPTFANCFADPLTGRRSTGYTHDVLCVNYRGPDADYTGREICIGSNETAISIADVTSKATPVAVSRASYPAVGYAHQGWLSEDQRYFYLDDELDELVAGITRTRTLIWDVSDLDDPVLAAEHLGETESSDHNLYVSGNRLYQSNYVTGLRILDITQPESPAEIGFFDTDPTGDNLAGFGGAWSNYPFFASGVVIVTSDLQGLFVLKPSP